MDVYTLHLPFHIKQPLGVLALLGSCGAGTDLEGSLGHNAHVHDWLCTVGFPVIQIGFKVIGKTQAQPLKLALGHQSTRVAGRDYRVLQRDHNSALGIKVLIGSGAECLQKKIFFFRKRIKH